MTSAFCAAWEKAGATGWSHDTLLPFLKRSEKAPGMDPRWRGTNGPMQVAPGPAAQPGSFYHACYQAAEQTGAPATADGNGEQVEGSSPAGRAYRNAQASAHVATLPAHGHDAFRRRARCVPDGVVLHRPPRFARIGGLSTDGPDEVGAVDLMHERHAG